MKSLTLIASERFADADPDMPILILPSLSITNGRNRWIGLIEMLSSRIRSERGESTQVLAHAFDAEKIQNIAELNFDRTPNILTTFNHTTLGGGERWLGRLNEIAVPTLIIHGTEDPVSLCAWVGTERCDSWFKNADTPKARDMSCIMKTGRGLSVRLRGKRHSYRLHCTTNCCTENYRCARNFPVSKALAPTTHVSHFDFDGTITTRETMF